MKIGFIFFTLVILGFVYLIFLSPVFLIKNISVSSDNLTCSSAEEIEQAIQINRANFFSLKTDELEKKIKDKFICIKSVNLSKQIPNKINLGLKNRQAVLNLIPQTATIESTSSSQSIATESGFLVDSEGVIFQKANFEIKLQPILFQDSLAVGKKLGGNLVVKISWVLDTLKSLGIPTTVAKIYSSNLFSSESKPQIIFRLDETLDRQLASLQLIVNQAKIDEKEIEFIDLRFDKPVVRYAPKK